MTRSEPRVLQLCHSHSGPFLDCARQYAALFERTEYKVTTVYLTGAPSTEVERGSASDEVFFLHYRSEDVRGLKFGAIRSVRQIVAGRDFRLCIAHRFKPVYVALLGSTLPVIGVHHGFGDYRRLSRRLFAGFFRNRLALLGVSDAVRDDMRVCLPSWPPERIETLYNRIDVDAVQAELLDRASARDALGLPEDAWVAGNVGRLHPDKDQATLIRGFALALPQLPPDGLLAIMGSGKLEASLQALATELGIAMRVCFLGQVPQGRRYFRAFDVFVLTSDHEPFGMVLLEAMAAGVPLICSDCGGGREVIDGVGCLFPLGNTEALATLLKRQALAVTTSLPAQMDRLRDRFSDTAAYQRFWSLPLLRMMR
jgi:glycosyltransferase involved in cell wall biosynthesis